MSNLNLPKPRCLLWDIETSYYVHTSWTKWTPGMKLVKEKSVICIAYKWLGEKTTHVISIGDDKKRFAADPFDDRYVIEKFQEIINQADLTIAHNGDKFDMKFFNSRLIKHGFNPILVKTYDTLKGAKRFFAFHSNRLGDIAKYLGVSKKTRTEMSWWDDILFKNCKKSLKLMEDYCITPDHKLLTKDLRWVEAREVSIGDKILGFDEEGPNRKYKEAEVKKIKYKDAPVYKVTLSNGEEIKVTADHKWLVCRSRGESQGGGYTFDWVETKDLRDKNSGLYQTKLPKLFNTWTESTDKDAGWLAGMFDGEGCLGERHRLTISQRPTEVLTKLEELIKKYNPAGTSDRLVKESSDCVSLYVRGSIAERAEFLGKIRPERLLNKVDFNTFGRLEARGEIVSVESVESIGEQEIIMIETSTGTFICEGFPMHNCKQDVIVLEDVYRRLLPFIQIGHPTYNALTGIPKDINLCPSCGSQHFIKDGYKVLMTGKYSRYQCQDCGHKFRGKKPVEPELSIQVDTKPVKKPTRRKKK